jgi:class 3 adenylate cyclase/tetratricopeptide (TPR) repeat protein
VLTCPNCGQENPDGFKFCGACASPLAEAPAISCPSCGQENPPGFTFCGACGTSLAEPEPAPEEERKVVTALFTDIVGSTASAEQLDPEDVRARLAPYYARVRAELESFGGTVEKFIGDAVVALFGAPVAHEDDPERAVRAAMAITKAVAELNEEDSWLDLHIRTAVHTGEALVVVGARAVEGEGMAAGDVMNTAARLQGGAPVDGIVVGEATFRATADVIEYREAEPVQAKGKTEPIPIWEVVGEKAAPERVRARTPLVGRGEELAFLSAIWDRVLSDRYPHIATVLGPPGIGKTRLLLALIERAEREGDVYWGRCLPYGEGITYWPITEMLKDAAGIRQSDDPATVSAKLGDLLEGLPTSNEDELRTMAAAFANLIGAPVTPHGTYSASEISKAELHWGIRRVFQLLSLGRPLLLVFEDLHWAEPTLVELVAYIQDGYEEAPFLVIASARPEFAEEETKPAMLVEGERRHVQVLDALTEHDSEALVGALVGADMAGEGMANLMKAAAGNPLFLEETVSMLADSGMLTEGADVEALPVPDNLQALIGSRLDALVTRDKRVAQHAAVVGSVFWVGAVGHLQGSNGDLGSSLEMLERRDFVHARAESAVSGDDEYAFKHILIRDVAYERLPKGRRAELHFRFVDWLSALPTATDEFVEISAYHLEQSCLLARGVARSPIEPPVVEAAAALIRAAEKAERREGAREADRYYERALDLVGEDHPALLAQLRLGRGRAMARLGEVNASFDELCWVVNHAAAAGRPDLRGAALVTLAGMEVAQGQADLVRKRLEEASAIASELGDRQLEIRTGYVFASLRGDYDGDLDAALEHLHDSLAIAEEVDDLRLRVEGHLRAGFFHFNKGELARADEELRRCIALAEDLGSFRDQARATFLLGLVEYYRGDLEEAERLGLQTAEWLERTGDGFFQVQNLARALALYALARDDAVLAEQRVREVLPLALELVGSGAWLAWEAYRYLVEALVRQGRVDDAAELAEFAGRDVQEENLYPRALVELSRALVLAAQGDRRGSWERFEEALELLERQGLAVEVPDARISYGSVLRHLGDERAAREQFERARTGLAAIGATRLVEQLDAELAELAVGPA